ncbi:MAG: hypothetical protein LBH49_03940 [Puniceicoccales bacterium]|nr:hypothetical protein [Puniceicoccales bacterium]
MDTIKIKKYLAGIVIFSSLSWTSTALAGKHNKLKRSTSFKLKPLVQRPSSHSMLLSIYKSESLSDDPCHIGFGFGENPSGPESARHRKGLLRRTITSEEADLDKLDENGIVSDIIAAVKYTALHIVANELPSFVRTVINEFRSNDYTISNMEESNSLRLFIMNEDSFAYSVDGNRLASREKMAIRYFAKNVVSGDEGFLYQVGLRAMDELLLMCYGFKVKLPKSLIAEIESQIRGILSEIGTNIINLVTNCLNSYANSHQTVSKQSILSSFLCKCDKTDEMPPPMNFSIMCSNMENDILESMGFDLGFVNNILNRGLYGVDREMDFSEELPQELKNMVIMKIYMNLANTFPSFTKNMIIDMLKNYTINSQEDMEANIKMCLTNTNHRNIRPDMMGVTHEDLTIMRRSIDAISGNGGLFSLILRKVLTTIRLWYNVFQLPINRENYDVIKDFAIEVISGLEEPVVRSLIFELDQRHLFNDSTGKFSNKKEIKNKNQYEMLKQLKGDFKNLAIKLIDNQLGKGVSAGVLNFLHTIESAVTE